MKEGKIVLAQLPQVLGAAKRRENKWEKFSD